MPKSRRSTRNKKPVTYCISKSSNSNKRQNVKAKTPQTRRNTRQNPQPESSSSETSPFRGFDNSPARQIKVPRLFSSLLSEESPEKKEQPENGKDDIFNSLLDDEHKSPFHHNMKTYENKKKVKLNDELLELSNSKSRAEIFKWLNDTRNVFDRLTQTQADVGVDVNAEVTFDMPSVSQKTSVSNRLSGELKTPRQNPYNLRARSLDIHVKKNRKGGRNKRHSLAGDTLELGSYQIEDVLTDVNIVVPAEKDAKIIVDLMEDEYLENIEREMHGEKKSPGVTGWDRVKDMNKSLNKQPKQLKVVKDSPQKDGDLLNNNSCYEYDLLENYFIENMEKLMCDEKHGKVSIEKLLQAGKDFVQVLKKIIGEEGRDGLHEFKPVVDDLKKVFDVVAQVSTQTDTNYVDKMTQIELCVEDMGVQTESNAIHMGVQTNEPVLKHEKLVQTEISKNSVKTQTVNEPDTGIKLAERRNTETSTTPSDIFVLDDEERREINNAFNTEFANEPSVEKEEENRPKSEPFQDDIDFEFNTEDILKEASKTNLERDNVGATSGSIFVVSGPSNEGIKGTKRLLSESPVQDPDKYRSKRPCAEFINEDLSVAFSEGEGVKSQEEKREVVIELSDDNDSEYNHYIDKVLKKYKSPSPEVPSKTRTQEQIEELEEMIANVRRPTRATTPPKETKPQSPRNQEEPADYFKSFSYFSNSEKTPKKIRRNLFDAKSEEVKPSSAFSESMFASEENVTVVADQTLTEDNVDIVMKQFDQSVIKEDYDVDQEVEEIMKVHVLENVVVKRADSVKEEDLSQCSDVDIVECTPQKIRFPSFVTDREESALDVTLPPPIEFQDSEKPKVENLTPKNGNVNEIFSPPRRPLAVINKVTSTPTSQKQDSDKINLSPISCHGNIGKTLPKTPHEQYKKIHFSPIKQMSRESNKSTSNRENRRVPGPYELAQQQFSKFCPLTIIKKPLSQNNSCRLNSTPKQKSILTYVRPSQENVDSPTSQKSASFEGLGKRKPCVACSRVTKEQVIAISSLTNKKLATYSTSFSPKVTHLIVSTNEKNCLRDHTIKFVSAVASGIWVLNFGWVQQCLLKNALVPEEPFEVLDVSGAPGPQRSRLNRAKKPLFRGYKIHAAAPFASTTQQEVENVVRMLGGKVAPSPEHLLDKNGYVCVIVTEARATQDFELYETWLEALKVVTVDIEWLSRSVGQYNLLSLRPFTLCSDDVIENLGYPPELTVNMTYSFSQQTFSSVPSSS